MSFWYKSVSASMLALFVLFWTQSSVGTSAAQGAKGVEKKRRTFMLQTFYKAYVAHELSKGKPALKIDQLPLEKIAIKEMKKLFVLDELGLSLGKAKKAKLAKLVMVYEKTAPKMGGLVLFYDGSVKTLSSKRLKKLLGKKK